MLGGAGNVVRNLDALGAAVDFVSVIGGDGAGEEVAALVAALPSVSASLITDPARRTTIKDRYIAGVQQLLRVDRESMAPVEAPVAAQVAASASKALANAGALIVSDYGKGVLAGPAIAQLIDTAARAGCPVVVEDRKSTRLNSSHV